MLLIVVAMLSFWTFVVCFPNPLIFARNVKRYINLPVDPSVIEIIDAEIPDEPEQIERFALKLIEYQYDWENYGMPDYVATARESVTKRRGDCEDRAIVLASLFEAKNIPYNLRASIVHYWVDYSGKKVSKSENENVAFFKKEDGKFRLKLPDMGQWRRYFNAGKKGFWDVMPESRKALMLFGWAIVLALSFFLNRKHEDRGDSVDADNQ